MIDLVVFYGAAALALVSAIVVIGQRNPLYSALALIVTLCSLAAIFGILGSPFIAVIQVIVYAGAIMVLFLFVIMLLSVKREEPGTGQAVFRGTAAALAAVLVLQLGTVLLRAERPVAPAEFDASTRRMAEVLFSPYFLYAFEATAVLILAALVGAVVLAKKDL
jgi:NADH-quinone oxidoreductase subunit J